MPELETVEQQKILKADAPTTESPLSQAEPAETLTHDDSPVFKAVGIIQGEVSLSEDGNNTITVNGKTYRLKYASAKRATLRALKLEIKNTGSNFQRLIVYPRVIHFPRQDQPHSIYFELVGFEGVKAQEKGLFDHLDNLEFKLCGLWQFIPVCRIPCVSIFKNFNEERKLFIKQVEPVVKVRFMKAAHLPLLWKNSSVRPFRYNPRLGKEQGRPMFVQLKARFLPDRDTFGFVEQMAEPLAESPRFLKASKEDKAEQRKNSVPPKASSPAKRQVLPRPKLTRPSKPVQ